MLDFSPRQETNDMRLGYPVRYQEACQRLLNLLKQKEKGQKNPANQPNKPKPPMGNGHEQKAQGKNANIL